MRDDEGTRPAGSVYVRCRRCGSVVELPPPDADRTPRCGECGAALGSDAVEREREDGDAA